MKGSEEAGTTSSRAGKSGVMKGKSRAMANKGSPATLKLESHEILAGYAMEILSASGLRQHTIAVIVDNESVSLWYFDRSGAISSTDMNLSTKTGREAFYGVLDVFGCARRDDWGYVKRLCPSAWWPSLENAGGLLLWDRDDRQQSWELSNLKRLNTGSRGLVSRGTMVYSFGDDDNDPDAPYALKLSWQPVSRPSETGFLVRAQDAAIDGIPIVLAGDALANLSDGIRGRLSPSFSPGPEQTDRQLRVLVFDRVCRPLNEFPIMERPLDFLRILKQLIISASQPCGLLTQAHNLNIFSTL
jgi:hypothetical protein